ncbi:MAG TPA: hypothetical protein VNO81_06830 [Candidatus Nitrosotenuis sp.]|jgi:hypothetical protein|nr:hypothetical protein [Candidatus Nitrosotenuis sp.]
MSRLFATLLGLALAAVLAAPALAEVNLSFSQIHFSGTVQDVVPGGVLLSTPAGSTLVPSSLASFQSGGVGLSYSQLTVGAPVLVSIAPASGLLVSADPDFVVLQLSQGPLVLPASSLPEPSARTRVDVRLPNGNVVNVPLNAALNMVRAQGATILGTLPPGVTAVSGNGLPGVVVGQVGSKVLLSCSENGRVVLRTLPASSSLLKKKGRAVLLGSSGEIQEWPPGLTKNQARGSAGQGQQGKPGHGSHGQGKPGHGGGKPK